MQGCWCKSAAKTAATLPAGEAWGFGGGAPILCSRVLLPGNSIDTEIVEKFLGMFNNSFDYVIQSFPVLLTNFLLCAKCVEKRYSRNNICGVFSDGCWLRRVYRQVSEKLRYCDFGKGVFYSTVCVFEFYRRTQEFADHSVDRTRENCGTNLSIADTPFKNPSIFCPYWKRCGSIYDYHGNQCRDECDYSSKVCLITPNDRRGTRSRIDQNHDDRTEDQYCQYQSYRDNDSDRYFLGFQLSHGSRALIVLSGKVE